MKKVITICIAIMLIISTLSNSASAQLVSSICFINADTKINEIDCDITNAYILLCSYIEDYNICASISLETFIYEYEIGNYSSVTEYLETYYSHFQQSTNRDASAWYYNTGINPMTTPNYNTYNLMAMVQPGDILYESEGGFGITGHAAIVEGVFYDYAKARFYIRLVEAIGYLSNSGAGDGVCRSILDDDRFVDRGGQILRVSSATTAEKNAAVDFCIGQIGKNYNLDLAHNTSSNEEDWYCSELIWAAYMNQGIDIETSNQLPGITPHEIRDSSLVSNITVSQISTPLINSITFNSSTSVTVKWQSISGASYYKVYRSTAPNGTYTYLASTSNNTYTNTGLAAGTTYYYRVAVHKTAGDSNKSNPVASNTTFSAPTITRYCKTSATSITLHWTCVYSASQYYVYRSTSLNGTYTKIATTTLPSFGMANLSDGTRYYFKVSAVNGNTETEPSYSKSITPCSVERPTIYYAKAVSSSKIIVKWTNVPGATKYYVYRSTTTSGTFPKVAEEVKTRHNSTGLSALTNYYYKIRAYNEDLNKTSKLSDYMGAKTKGA